MKDSANSGSYPIRQLRIILHYVLYDSLTLSFLFIFFVLALRDVISCFLCFQFSTSFRKLLSAFLSFTESERPLFFAADSVKVPNYSVGVGNEVLWVDFRPSET